MVHFKILAKKVVVKSLLRCISQVNPIHISIQMNLLSCQLYCVSTTCVFPKFKVKYVEFSEKFK